MLYIISTPIGNLADISLRAISVLKKLDFILAEDTRNTYKLLKNLGIRNLPKMISYYDEVEDGKTAEIVKYLDEGKEVGLLCDSGTPLIADPGWKLINICQKRQIKYTAIPGPVAAINALVLSGLPVHRFYFFGFLPKKVNQRMKLLKGALAIDGSKIAYESPYRIKRLIGEVKQIFGAGVEIRVIREMTKIYEEVLKADDIRTKTKGEIVLIWN